MVMARRKRRHSAAMPEAMRIISPLPSCITSQTGPSMKLGNRLIRRKITRSKAETCLPRAARALMTKAATALARIAPCQWSFGLSRVCIDSVVAVSNDCRDDAEHQRGGDEQADEAEDARQRGAADDLGSPFDRQQYRRRHRDHAAQHPQHDPVHHGADDPGVLL